jgi:hypothetical protein
MRALVLVDYPRCGDQRRSQMTGCITKNAAELKERLTGSNSAPRITFVDQNSFPLMVLD